MHENLDRPYEQLIRSNLMPRLLKRFATFTAASDAPSESHTSIEIVGLISLRLRGSFVFSAIRDGRRTRNGVGVVGGAVRLKFELVSFLPSRIALKTKRPRDLPWQYRLQ